MKKKPTALALSVIILEIIAWLNIVFFIVMFGYQIYVFMINSEQALFALMLSGKFIMSIFALFIGILLLYLSKGLSNQKKWAKIATTALGILMLLGFPIGTMIGILLIYGTTKGWTMPLVQQKI